MIMNLIRFYLSLLLFPYVIAGIYFLVLGLGMALFFLLGWL
jgi:hypothetical protein